VWREENVTFQGQFQRRDRHDGVSIGVGVCGVLPGAARGVLLLSCMQDEWSVSFLAGLVLLAQEERERERGRALGV